MGGRAAQLYALTLSPNATMTGTATLTSQAVDLHFMRGYAAFAAWTGTPVGNFHLEGSNDNTNWATIANSTVAAGGAAGSNMWNMYLQEYRYVRLVYVNGSSTGTVTVANIYTKEFS